MSKDYNSSSLEVKVYLILSVFVKKPYCMASVSSFWFLISSMLIQNPKSRIVMRNA